MQFILKKEKPYRTYRTIDTTITLESEYSKGSPKPIVNLVPYEDYITLSVIRGEIKVRSSSGTTSLFFPGDGTWLYNGDKVFLSELEVYQILKDNEQTRIEMYK